MEVLGKEWAAILVAVIAGTGTIAVTGLVAGACLRMAERIGKRQTAELAVGRDSEAYPAGPRVSEGGMRSAFRPTR
jgi:hypothetical protein